MRRRLLLVPFGLWLGTLIACGDSPPDWQERSVQAVFDPADSKFWSLPFPSDLRRQADGSFGFQRWPMYGANSPLALSNELVGMWLRAADDRLKDGFGLSSGVFAPTNAALDPATLPATPAASLEPSASVYLLDIDPSSSERGRLFPLDVQFLADGDRYSPPNLIAAVPVFGFVRRPKTRYALVLTDGLQDTTGQALGRSRAFHDAFEGVEGADAAAVSDFEGLRASLEQIGRDPARVVGATVFTTTDQNALLQKLAAWAETLPLPELAPWKVAEDYESYQVLTSTFTVPVYQTGRRPYADEGEGRIIFGEDGNPVIQETQGVRLALTIPKRPQPASGFPLMMYLHGSGGEWYQAINRGPEPEDGSAPTEPTDGRGPAEWLARRGIATIAHDFPLHGNRNKPPDTSGLVFYNLFGNVSATIDNFNVANAELVLLSRLLLTMQIDPSLASTLDAGGQSDIHFDPERLTAMGQSMGTTLAVPWATVDPRVKGLLLSGAGGILVEIAVTALEPVPLKALLEGIVEFPEGEELHIHHPLLHAFQNLWDLVDPIAKAPYVIERPHDGIPAKHVMMTAGFRDGYFHPRSQAAMAVALGVSQVGDEIEPTLPDALRLAGHSTLSYPLAPNLNERVAGVVHFAAPNTLGHYVVFNQDGARFQYTCFLKSVGDADGPRILAARGLDDACP